MKQIINGKMYNTETATHILNNSNHLGQNDFRCLDEDLYQKKTGEFFIHGEGGALTRYAEVFPDGKGYGEKIIPLSEDEAKEFVEEFGDADLYINLFGEPEE